jgi:hypothetical protein
LLDSYQNNNKGTHHTSYVKPITVTTSQNKQHK